VHATKLSGYKCGRQLQLDRECFDSISVHDMIRVAIELQREKESVANFECMAAQQTASPRRCAIACSHAARGMQSRGQR